jgi:hypothetical protein
MKPRSTIKTDLFADEHHRKKIDKLGDPLTDIGSHIDFAALAAEIDRVASRPVSPQGGPPPYGGQIIDATLVPAPKQHNSRSERTLLDQGALPADWKPAKRRQKDIDATPGRRSTARPTSATSCRSTSTKSTSSSARSRPTPPARTTVSTSTAYWIWIPTT